MPCPQLWWEGGASLVLCAGCCALFAVGRAESTWLQCILVQFSCLVVSDSLQPHGLQHARPPCPSPTPGACSNSCPLSRWCHPTISSSVVPFSSLLQSFPASGGQNIGVSVLASVLPMNIKDWFPLIDWFDLLVVQGTLKRLLQHHSSKASVLWCSAFFMVQLSHPYMTTGKTIALTRQTFVGKVMSLLFNMLCRLVIAFLPRSKCLLISWLQVTICSDFEAQENEVSYYIHCFPIYLPWICVVVWTFFGIAFVWD